MRKIFDSLTSKTSNKNIIKQADSLRDAGNFADAAILYANYLGDNPSDFDIWVQRGNCLKDSGQHESAQIAYEAAKALRPGDADVYLQMGHLYKIQGRRKDAIRCYEKSLELDPSSVDAAFEIRNFGIKLKNSFLLEGYRRGVVDNCNIYDITDLLSFLRDHEILTGIQRVQYFIIKFYLSKMNYENQYISGGATFCYLDTKKLNFNAINIKTLNSLMDLISSQDISRNELDTAINNIEKSSVPVEFKNEDSFVILGAFWVVPKIHFCLFRIKRRGVKVGVYVHDLIPITHPNFVEENTRKSHVDSFKSILPLCDFILSVSGFVEGEIRSIMAIELGRDVPTSPVRLGHALPDQDEDLDYDTSFDQDMTPPSNYVLSVGTIEGRKNHILLINIWISLYRKYHGNIPNLLLVGRWGWHTEHLQKKLEDIKYLDGKIIVIGNISDQQLAKLYKNCLFTAFPSFAEGWGLPVGESLAHGKPCIASNVTSIPEVGGEFCRYINPYDPIGATKMFDKTISDRDDLAKWELDIKQNFRPRKWEDMAQNFHDKVRTLSDRAVSNLENNCCIELTPGIFYQINHENILADTVSWSKRMYQFILSDNWHDIEHWGVWSSKQKANISFSTPFAKTKSVRVAMRISIPEPHHSGNIILICGNTKKSIYIEDGRPTLAWLDCTVDKLGIIDIIVERIGRIEHIYQDRPLFVGLSSIGYYFIDDLHSKLNLLESMLSNVYL